MHKKFKKHRSMANIYGCLVMLINILQVWYDTEQNRFVLLKYIFENSFCFLKGINFETVKTTDFLNI